MNNLIVSGTTITTDEQGLFCINDLHKASGGDAKNKPSNWMASGSTPRLIELMVLTAEIPAVKTKEGRYGGTYVCKELVYSYAMWVSAEFALHVIRTFDTVASGGSIDRDVKRYMQLGDAIESAKAERDRIESNLESAGLVPFRKRSPDVASALESAVARLVATYGCAKLAKKEFIANSDAPTAEAARKRFERAYSKCKLKGLV